MGSETSSKPLETKTWQIEQPGEGREGYLYYCCLCDEALVLSVREISSRKINLVFDETCPGCGFELDKALKCQDSFVPTETNLFVNPKCTLDESLLERENLFTPRTRRGSELLRDSKLNITTGIETLDRLLTLQPGQLVALQGEQSHSLSLLLCVRATVPQPRGIDSDIVFIDGGNLFDAYEISQYSAAFGLDSKRVLERVHLSRAFTYHQLNSLITRKLPLSLGEYKARLVVISDITLLYCDPDARDKQEALDLFKRNIRFLASLAEQKEALVLVTNLQSRNRSMENALTRSVHVFARLDDGGAFTAVSTLSRSEETEAASLGSQTLGAVFDRTNNNSWKTMENAPNRVRASDTKGGFC